MEESKLIILRGNSGSGKTTIAKALQQKLGENTLLISQDVIRRDMLKAKDGYGTKALPLLLSLAKYGKENCPVVILEGILNSKWYEHLFTELVTLFENKIHAYYFDIPFEETLKRHKTKDKSKEFGEEEMRSWWNEKDYLKCINETSLYSTLTEENILNMIYTDIGIL